MIFVAKNSIRWRSDHWKKDGTIAALFDLNYAWGFAEEDIAKACADSKVLSAKLSIAGRCYDLVGDGVVTDLELLRRLGARGSVIFVDTFTRDRPFIEAVLSDSGVSWFTAKDISGLQSVDVNEL